MLICGIGRRRGREGIVLNSLICGTQMKPATGNPHSLRTEVRQLKNSRTREHCIFSENEVCCFALSGFPYGLLLLVESRQSENG
jgi:hypothetical protein